MQRFLPETIELHRTKPR